ncbi:helix-turn-helix domain-containing protein [Chitinophaga qingshengii]|uniref:AraC family transcriptional regulator n=1 Tax=Chitinophaga qingshengii TaxID=1569794 RepID=A0ABR7TYB8_9BACT|nr:helix-turn-helix domain-containing protein [Chitinophaga qingshengii]MBC9934499.1 AraC family transcriptional regulator [Chitinophaga qingshengii]
MIYREFAPHPQLAPYVECYWKADADRPPFREEESLIPDGTIELMFNFGDNYARIKDGARQPVKGSHVIGIRQHALRISQTHHQHVFSVRFRLGGAYPLFHIPTYLLANDFWSLPDILGKDYTYLEERLYEAATDEQRVAVADRFLLDRLQFGDQTHRFLQQCTTWMLQQENVTIADTCNAFGVSYKVLERRFSQAAGLTPIELLKIRRFNKAILAMYSCRYASLTAIAYSCGFYDQSHFIREFKQLSGTTPRHFLQEQYTIVQVIQPALATRLAKSYNL